MQTDYVKAAVIGAWILAVVALGLAAGVTSFVGWAVVALLSLAPPAVLMGLWRAPSPTMSETIREVLR